MKLPELTNRSAGRDSCLPTPVILVVSLFLAQLAFTSKKWAWEELAAPDLYVLGLTLVAAISIPSIGNSALRMIAHWILALGIALYSLTVVPGMIFGLPLSLADLIKYLPEGRAILSFIEWRHALLLITIIYFWPWHIALARPVRTSYIILSAAFIFGGWLMEPLSETKHRLWEVFHLNKVDIEINQYSTTTIEMLQNGWSKHSIKLPPGVKHYVLVVVESLSAEDSLRTSGLLDRLPLLDKWSQDGIIFDNFIANYSDSEGGLVALLAGIPPIPYPGGSRNIYRSFSHQPSVVDELNQLGFHTELLTTGPLSFLNSGKFFNAIGISKVRGRDEVAAFKSAPKVSFNSPPDAYLYDEALKRIDILNARDAPYFLTLLTVSSHPPMVDPEGRENSQDKVWEYVDRQLHYFYQQLRKQGFFDQGLLLVTSDHRKMYPPIEEVRRHYGKSNEARIPLVVVGHGIAPGKIDHRLLQQSDLIRNLGNLTQSDIRLIPLATYVERYSMHYGETSTYGKLRVINPEGKVFPASVRGIHFKWEEDIPQQAEAFERALHAQRSEHQHLRQHSSLAWRPEFIPQDPNNELRIPGGRPGLLMELYKDTDINETLHADSSRFLRALRIEQLDFPDLSTLLDDIADNYSLRITGKLYCPTDGRYQFRIESDDGSGLALDHVVVVDANFSKSFGPEDGSLFLTGGLHELELRYFQKGGGAGLRLSWKKPGDQAWEVIPGSVLTH